jgi:hypothetical protein
LRTSRHALRSLREPEMFMQSPSTLPWYQTSTSGYGPRRQRKRVAPARRGAATRAGTRRRTRFRPYEPASTVRILQHISLVVPERPPEEA